MCRSIKVILVAAAMLAGGNLFAEQFAYIVQFTNKDNTPYTLTSPLSYLSARALDRRATQGIAVDSTDLPVYQPYIDTVLQLTGGTLHTTSRWLNHCVILINDSADIHLIEDKPYISGTRFVAWYEHGLHRPATGGSGTGTGSNPLGNKKTWGSSDYGTTWVQTAMVKGQALHDDNYTGNGKLIAVIDAGFIDVDTHTGFTAMLTSGRLIDKHNFTLADDFIYGYDVHGTRALSTIAGYVPGTFIGSAPMASYALYISEDNNSEQMVELTNMLAATERADSVGADIVTSSLGYNTFNNADDNFDFATDFDGKSTIAAKAANIATSKGMLFVASAGNEGGGGWNMVLTPGDADSALTIGSVDYAGVSAPNSGYGPNAAGRVKPDVACMGQAAAVFFGVGYGNQSGTSFSTPQIAGWAACLWQAYPSAKPFQIRDAITRCASRYTSPTVQQGYGIPDFFCAKQVMLGVNDNIKLFAPDTWVAAAPNPFHDVVNLVVAPDQDQTVAISVSDISGRVVFTTEQFFSKGYNNSFPVSLQGLPAGIYMLKAVSASQQQVLKLVKE